ncbi:hypothetical protein CRENBAI_001893 [Crenichthys baileyi]|uniref:Uncharacterized protein n=1 Tax=Crenichthys baileyi TaxID=28760 RepID=A0AAV9SP15_9TELE
MVVAEKAEAGGDKVKLGEARAVTCQREENQAKRGDKSQWRQPLIALQVKASVSGHTKKEQATKTLGEWKTKVADHGLRNPWDNRFTALVCFWLFHLAGFEESPSAGAGGCLDYFLLIKNCHTCCCSPFSLPPEIFICGGCEVK